MKKNLFQDFLKPILVLFLIAAVVAALLAFVHHLTEPVILENQRIAAETARKEVLPGSEEFTEIECDQEALNITGAYKENSGRGYVITSANKGYGGLVTVTVGLNGDGEIVGLKVDVSTETSGVGTKAGKEDYIQKYIGLSGSCGDVATISGATYSSKALKAGVTAALQAFSEVAE